MTLIYIKTVLVIGIIIGFLTILLGSVVFPCHASKKSSFHCHHLFERFHIHFFLNTHEDH